MPKTKSTDSTAKQGAKFGLVGVSNTVIDFTLFTIGKAVFNVPLEQVYLVKYFSGSAAMINSFYWNRRWVFHNKSRLDKTVIKFLVATLTSVYLIQPNVVRLFTATHFGQNFGHFWFAVGKSIGIVGLAPTKLTDDFVISTAAFGMGVIASAIWNFTLYKLWAFRNKS
jgi:putative flippase GtrA